MRAGILVIGLVVLAAGAQAAPAYVDVPVGVVKQSATVTGFGLPASFGAASEHFAVFRLGPLAAGKRYEVTMTYDAGTDIGYATSWVDGDPMGKDFASFVGIGTGTGTREIKGKEDRFLFTVDARSTANALYLVVRSAKPWRLSMGLSSPSGVTRDSQDKWGYYYVTDFDVNRISPFSLTRGPAR